MVDKRSSTVLDTYCKGIFGHFSKKLEDVLQLNGIWFLMKYEGVCWSVYISAHAELASCLFCIVL